MIANKILSPGWAMAELISMRLLPLWVGARGIEFSWKYIQLSFEANISLVSCVFVYNVHCTQCKMYDVKCTSTVYNVHSSVYLCQIFSVLVLALSVIFWFCVCILLCCPTLLSIFPIHSIMCPNVYLTVPSPPGSPHNNGDANLDVD